MMSKLFLVLSAVLYLAAAGQAQQISPKLPSNFTDLEQEVRQREAVNYTGFVYKIAADQVRFVGCVFRCLTWFSLAAWLLGSLVL